MSLPIRRNLLGDQPAWFRCLILVVVGSVARLPALTGQFIWDDTSLVRDNPFVKSPVLWLESFRHYLALDGSSMHYRPLQNISYFFDYLVWNTEAFGYHLSNLVLHVSCGVLLYFLLKRLFETWRTRFPEKPQLLSAVAFLVALIWVVHPVHSAAVDYISGRADSLAFFFAAAAWLAYFKLHAIQSRGKRIALSLVPVLLAGAALCSRESGCIWIAVFLLHLFAFDAETSRRSKAIIAAICLLIFTGYAALRQLPIEHVLSSPAAALPLGQRAVLMVRALGDYAQLLVFPWNLHLERTVALPPVTLRTWGDALSQHYLSVIGAITALGLLYGAFRKGPARSVRLFGAAWFVVGYLPVSNLFPLNATVAEHWLYLPSVGVLIVAAGVWLECAPRQRQIFAAVGMVAVLALSARSFIRSGDWRNPENFYQRSIAAGAVNTRFSLNLAQSYADKNDLTDAEALLRNLTLTHPTYVLAQNALGHVLLQEGEFEEAARVFARAEAMARQTVSAQPRNWIGVLNLAYIKNSQHDFTGALAVLEKARVEYPGTWRLVGFESEILRNSGEQEKALALVAEFRVRNWWHHDAAVELGRILQELHRYSEASAIWQDASRLDIHDAESLNLIAALNIEQNNLNLACAAQRRAVQRQPDQPHQYVLLADILERSGRHAEAQDALAQVRSLRALAAATPN